MKFKLTILIIPLILVLNCFLRAQDEGSAKTALPEVSIAGTQLQKIHSAIDGKDYDLYINLPRYYNDTTKTFPVLYVLDGQWDFALAESIFGQQYFDGFVPAMIVVGITWGGDNPNYDSLRAQDLTPTSTGGLSQYGNAPKFLQCIKNEIIPFVDSKYRTTKNDRTLMGSSFGGLFTLYTLFNETDLFNKYILTSPALTWDNGVIYKFEKNYAEKNHDLQVRLFMGIGQYENVSILQKFNDKLRSRNYKSLQMQMKVIDGMGHSGAKAEGFTKGMQFVFKRPELKIDPVVLKQFSGNYEVAPNVIVKISVENNHLTGVGPDGNKIVLYAESESEFYVIGSYLFVHFKKDETGKITGFQLETFTGNNFFKKI